MEHGVTEDIHPRGNIVPVKTNHENFDQERPLTHSLTIRVAIADDHPLLLAGLKHELQAHPGVTVVGSAKNSSELVALLIKYPVDVVVSDYSMPGGSHGDGITLFGFLKRRFPSIGLIALTMMSNAGVIRSLMAQNIVCILSKADSLDYLTGALYAARTGKRYLSPSIEAIVQAQGIGSGTGNSSTRGLTVRELEVVRLFVSGLTVSEIAERVHRSKQTVSTQKMSAMRKLGLSRDADLIKYGIDEHLTVHAIDLNN